MKRNWKLNKSLEGGLRTFKVKKKKSKYKSTRTSRPELATYFPNRKKEDNKE